MAPETGVDDLLSGLNPVQHEAVIAPDGPLLIVAGAGSGKTRVLTSRIAYLISERKVSPFQILAITFTNKAAGEMKERVATLVGPVARRMWVATFHSACSRILRREAEHLGMRSAFSIYDQSDAVRLVDYVRPRSQPRSEALPAPSTPRPHLRVEERTGDAGGLRRLGVHPTREDAGRGLHRVPTPLARRERGRLRRSARARRSLVPREPRSARRGGSSDSATCSSTSSKTRTSRNGNSYRCSRSEHRNVLVVGDTDQCLFPGTEITMADGTRRPVESVEVGDEVLSCYGSGDFRPARVARTHTARALGTASRSLSPAAARSHRLRGPHLTSRVSHGCVGSAVPARNWSSLCALQARDSLPLIVCRSWTSLESGPRS